MPTVVCGRCHTIFTWEPGAESGMCPRGHKLTLRDVNFVTEREGGFPE